MQNYSMLGFRCAIGVFVLLTVFNYFNDLYASSDAHLQSCMWKAGPPVSSIGDVMHFDDPQNFIKDGKIYTAGIPVARIIERIPHSKIYVEDIESEGIGIYYIQGCK
jgi:hypothetical protein